VWRHTPFRRLAVWWMAIPVVLSAASAAYSSMQQRDYGETAEAWQRYNASMQYNVSLDNLFNQALLTQYNAKMALAAGDLKASAIMASADYNVSLLRATTEYNDSLLEEEVSLLWESVDLDLELLEQQRARERGTILANQAASGTVMGEGSNLDVIISQKTQEALDAFIIRHGADIKAKQIQNARAQNLFSGEMQARKIAWEGELGAAVSKSMASIQASSMLMEGGLRLGAGLQTAEYQRQAGMYGASMTGYEWDQRSWSTLVQGMFSAASRGVSAYYGSKAPVGQDFSNPGTSPFATSRPQSNAPFGINPGV